MFDCRGDADSLYHEFDVRITNIYDLQLFEYMCRHAAGKPMVNMHANPKKIRGRITRGLGGTVQTYIKVTDANSERIKAFGSLKKAVHNMFENVPTIWRYRPLDDNLRKYAALDVANMWDIYNTLSVYVPLIGIKREVLEIASERYASSRRDCEASNRKFKSSRLMSFIIPEIGKGKTIKPFPVSRDKCKGCKRLMPSINKQSFCADCAEIMRVAKCKEK